MTVEEILALPLEELQERIRPAGFFKQKSQTIRGLLIWLREVGGFEVLSKIGTEELRKQLLELKGIGPETADALLLYLHNSSYLLQIPDRIQDPLRYPAYLLRSC